MRAAPSLRIARGCGRYGLRTKPTPGSPETASSDVAGAETRIRLLERGQDLYAKLRKGGGVDGGGALTGIWNQGYDDCILSG